MEFGARKKSRKVNKRNGREKSQVEKICKKRTVENQWKESIGK